MEISHARGSREASRSLRANVEAKAPRHALESIAQPAISELARLRAPAARTAILGMQSRIGNRAIARLLETRGGQRQAIEAGHTEHVAVPVTAVQRKPAKGKPKGTTSFKPVARKTYTVEAKTLEEAAAQLSSREEAGETTWDTASMVTNLDDDGNVKGATIEFLITVTMPSWPGAARLNKAARAEWNRAYKALKAHEDHHVKLAKEKLKGIADKMIGETESGAQDVLSQALQELQTASDQYDTTSDHGANEGTTINTSAGSPP